jgi:hypothetical protein
MVLRVAYMYVPFGVVNHLFTVLALFGRGSMIDRFSSQLEIEHVDHPQGYLLFLMRPASSRADRPATRSRSIHRFIRHFAGS